MTKVKTDQKQARPFLKWVGGKGRLLSQYSLLFPSSFNSYYEPFVGGGAVFFKLAPSKANINDLSQVLVNAYSNLQSDVENVIKVLSKLEKEYLTLNDDARKEFYYEKRSAFNELHDGEFLKTALLIFLNRTCFNGLYRENSKGEFNVPIGKYKNPRICNSETLRAVSDALRSVEITCSDFIDAVKNAKRNDFIYFDPPYHPLNPTSNFTSYHENDFTSFDQERLRDTFNRLSEKGCYVMLSNSNTPLIKELYKEFNINIVYAGRAINSIASKRGKIQELVITNYEVGAAGLVTTSDLSIELLPTVGVGNLSVIKGKVSK